MVNLQVLCIILLLCPLLVSMVLGCGCKYFKNNTTTAISIAGISISFLITLYFLLGFFTQQFKAIDSTWYVWVTFDNVEFKFGFLLDNLNIIMLDVVTITSLIVQIYSVKYMENDLSYTRFFSYIAFFTFAMLLLVIANNFLQLFVGWQLVGIASYLLINFWFKLPAANVAALKALIISKIGDCCLLLGIAAILKYCGSLDYLVVFNNIPSSIQAINIICGFLVIAAIVKSVQIPLHVWLPDAMLAPTPVSALMHAATMVTAGVFMLVRISPILECSAYWLNIILLIGALTTVLIGILAAIEPDIKKIIAYSTISQLGIMMAAVGASAYAAGMFHLINHAAFKSLLFLTFGVIVYQHIKITYWSMLIGILSLIGLPGFSGFFSKNLILTAVRLSNLPSAKYAYYLLLAACFITAFYGFRLFFILFYKKQLYNVKKTVTAHHSQIISGCLMMLAIFSLLSGGLLVLPVMNNQLLGINMPVLSKQHLVDVLTMFFNGFISYTGIFNFLGITSAIILYLQKPHLTDLIHNNIKKYFLFFDELFKNKYFLNEFNKLVIKCLQNLARFFSEIIEQLFINQIIINNTTIVLAWCSKFIQKMHNGYLYHQIFFMLTGVLVILLCLILTTF